MHINNKELQDTLFQGLPANNWGYGLKRITVELPQAVRGSLPYTFTSVGFKSEKGEYFIGLRMNVDQASPIKFRKCIESTDVIQSWADMLQEYIRDYNMNIYDSGAKNATYRLI